LGSKSKDSNIFKLDLNWSQTKINLNKIFKDFSNLELLKIDLNIQIQTKALNGGL
jgi:RNA recognition motif-containing protein